MNRRLKVTVWDTIHECYVHPEKYAEGKWGYESGYTGIGWDDDNPNHQQIIRENTNLEMEYE